MSEKEMSMQRETTSRLIEVFWGVPGSVDMREKQKA